MSTSTNSERQNVEFQATQPDTAPTVSSTNRQSKNYLKRTRKAILETCSSSVEKVTDYLQNMSSSADLDGTELVSLGYARTVKTFSSRTQAITKMKIAQIIMEQELEHEEEQTSSSRRSLSTDTLLVESSDTALGSGPCTQSVPPSSVTNPSSQDDCNALSFFFRMNKDM
jgi:hypothetical protein